MSDTEAKDVKPKKKGKGPLLIIIGAVVLLAVGGGGMFGLVQAGVIGNGHAEKEDNKPKLIRKGEEDPFAPVSEGEGEGGPPSVHGEGGSEFRTAYYTFDGEFTSNLRGSDALIQVSIAASTRRDGRVLMWLKDHELAIRSGLITLLADTPENDMYTIEGKARLRKRMTAEINRVLTEHEGFGGVDDVYFRTFIIQ
ncbi:flagellar basal body-associated FliL family protein [Novosphingobium aquimarinum]|uniref:flagellar basal body-associated FliL family protein n=1 Tax=Novosphingobium aquimarinum TaxID=2682494 RepID=UPI0012EBA7D4|nr:flagellar basal body-associated FliL family protein [Novosphingobium aquimarinum]